jgi:aerobic carbon-monoxide dehydrogenase large subunit
VAARDMASALDALEAIEVEYEPLPVVLDLLGAVEDGAALVHQDKGTNRAYTWIFDSAAAGTGGDVEQAEAEIVLERRYVQQRLIPAFMEPRSIIVDPGMGDFTIWSSTQVPHILRVFYALLTGTPEHKVRVIAPDVGGGFGGKLAVTPEELIVFYAARRIGKPVKYTESRGESMLSAHHGRDMIQDIKLTARRDGTLTSVSVKLLANMGAYLGLVGPGVPVLGAFMYNGIYKVPAYRFECTGVFTNTTVTDAYRGAGRPEATFAIERAMDELGVELGIDPIEIRRRNWIKTEEFPFTTVNGLVYDSGNYEAATDRALELLDYQGLRAEQAARRASGDPVQIGIGTSTFTEMCGLAPSRLLGALRYGAGGWETASVRVLPTGKIEVVTGTSPHGQGHVTAWSQIVADELGVAFEDVEVLHGDTRTSHKGLDTYGSRSLAVGGIALVEACRKVRDKARTIAAHMLECSPDDIEFTGGSFRVRGTPDAAKHIAELAFAVFTAHDLPDGVEASLDADATFDPQTFSFPHGTHLCAVEIDTETGFVKIRKYVAVDDVGKVVNPMIVEGQVHGGLAQGIAQALHEGAVYDESGTLLTGSFVEYTLPTAADLPEFTTDRTETPATSNPLGVKGVGEAGTIASTPAVVNAVVDALRPYGIHDVAMPCTPERVWRAIQQGGTR